MSWQKTSVMEEKIRFIRMWQGGEYTFIDLCSSFNISRTTGYKLIKQYELEGEKCFIEKSRRPKKVANKTSIETEKRIIELRKKHKNWGARKLMKLLEKELPKDQIPSETTVNAILKRNGFVKSRRRRKGKIEKQNPKFDPGVCNEIWSADYKGKFRLGNRRYCHVLTICDSKSRYIFSCKGHYNPVYDAVREEFIKVFKKYGLPRYLHTDNGPPFGSVHAVKRFSRLSYWLIDHGVYPIFSDPGCPQQNGRHERMHKDLKAYCTNPVCMTMRSEQKLLEAFRVEYNEVRPHEALEMYTPGEVHERSKREYSDLRRAYEYPLSYVKLKVTKNGAIRWGAFNWVYISRGSIGKYVGLEQIDNGIWKVYYRHVTLGYFDEKEINRRESNI